MTTTHTPSLAVLLIEDNPGDARLIELMLSEVSETAIRLAGADRLAAGIEHLARSPVDAVLLDLSVVATSALIALTFYTWAGAADALGQGATGRSVAAEFGSLMLIGLVVGLILSRA